MRNHCNRHKANPKAPKSTKPILQSQSQYIPPLFVLNHCHPNRFHGFCCEISNRVCGACGDGGDVHADRLLEVVRIPDTSHLGEVRIAVESTAAPAYVPCGPCIYAPQRSLRWLRRLLQRDFLVFHLPTCVLQSHLLHLPRVLLQDPSRHLGQDRRSRSLVDRWDQSHMVADHRGSQRYKEVEIEGMVGLVVRKELASEMERDHRSWVGTDTVVVVGSLVDGEVHHMERESEMGRDRRSSELEGIVDLLEQHSLAEEDIAADHRHIEVVEDSHLAAGYLRSNRCLTL